MVNMVNLGEPRFSPCSPPLRGWPEMTYDRVVNMVNLVGTSRYKEELQDSSVHRNLRSL